MIVLNLTLDGIYGFNDFMINFTYPKKIVKVNFDFLQKTFAIFLFKFFRKYCETPHSVLK